MNRTKIPWVRNPDGTRGYTWNFLTGCLGPDGTPEKPQRCPYCYAHKLAKGRLKKHYLSEPEYPNDPPLLVPNTDPSDPFIPRFWTHRLSEPVLLRRDSTIFACSMGDLFGNYIPHDWIERVLNVCRDNRRHTFQLLTKNPERIKQYSYPDNVWLGITVNSSQDWFRVWLMRDKYLTIKIKFISFEPLLDDVLSSPNMLLERTNWIIIGAQTNPYRPPKRKWVERIINEADKLDIPVFLKNNLKPLLGDNLRQEFPE